VNKKSLITFIIIAIVIVTPIITVYGFSMYHFQFTFTGQCLEGQLPTFNSINQTFTCKSVQASLGSMILLYDNETDVTQTVANSDTIMRSFNLPANTYSKIMVESESENSFGILSIVEVVNIKIKDSGVTMKSFPINSLASIGREHVVTKMAFQENSAKTITLTQGAALADGSTTITSHSFRIFAIP
jgi:hypothetical protein